MHGSVYLVTDRKEDIMNREYDIPDTIFIEAETFCDHSELLPDEKAVKELTDFADFYELNGFEMERIKDIYGDEFSIMRVEKSRLIKSLEKKVLLKYRKVMERLKNDAFPVEERLSFAKFTIEPIAS